MKTNFPFDDVVKKATDVQQRARRDGTSAAFYQKFTCSGCGQRLGMDEPNKFFTHGTCDRCPALTDIRKDGCNYVLIVPAPAGTPDGITIAQTRLQ